MKVRLFVWIVLLLASFSSVFASELDRAAAAYENGNYNESAAIYDSIAKKRGVSMPLLYNLGNAYLKAGDYGNAMVAYQRALLLDPSANQVKNNIAYLSSKVEDNNKAETKGKKLSVLPQERSFFGALRDFIAFSNLPDTWALWSGIMFIITCGCAALYIFVSNVLIRKIGFFGGFIALGISLITLLFSFISVSSRNNLERGVITGHKVLLHSEPYQSAKTIAYPLTRGTVMNVSASEPDGEGSGRWYKVFLNSDYTGWVKSSDFEVI
ncbi:MAG: tetratricopeptide repeat protein [Muribaculaceae bacterium]|nr:tetratricopeptide repeat protein [Muribaculaceae bacterium]